MLAQLQLQQAAEAARAAPHADRPAAGDARRHEQPRGRRPPCAGPRGEAGQVCRHHRIRQIAPARRRSASWRPSSEPRPSAWPSWRPEDVEVEVRRAEYELKAAEARRDQARLALEECRLKAPRPGTVLRILVGPGDVLGGQPGQPAVLFAADGPQVIRATVEQEFAEPRQGRGARSGPRRGRSHRHLARPGRATWPAGTISAARSCTTLPS